MACDSPWVRKKKKKSVFLALRARRPFCRLLVQIRIEQEQKFPDRYQTGDFIMSHGTRRWNAMDSDVLLLRSGNQDK